MKDIKEHIKREIGFLKLLEREHSNKRRLEDIRLRLKYLNQEVLKKWIKKK